MSIKKAADIIKKGGVIIGPTDSIYCLICDATNKKAVDRIYKIKKRKRNKPLQIYTTKKDIKKYAYLNDNANKIIKNLWPSSLSIVLKKKAKVPDFVTKNTVSLVCHKNKVLNRLYNLVKKPLIPTSANLAGKKFPIKISQIDKKIIEQVDFVLDDGTTLTKRPNTIIDLTKKKLKLIRKGPVQLKKIKESYIKNK